LAKIVEIKHTNIEKKQFEELFRCHYSELCSYANVFMQDLEDAEEIVQDIFVNFWNNRKEIQVVSSYRAYLFSSVKNSCLNKKKHILIREKYKEQNELELNQNSENPETKFYKTELEQKIREAIDKLPLKRREIFILSRYDGLKYQEIADKMGISIKTVENQMGSALKFLRIELIDYIILFLLIFLKI